MDERQLAQWARILVDYSLAVKKNERIMVSAPVAALPLVEAVYAKLLDRGAFPVLRLSAPRQDELFFAHAQEQHLRTLSPFARFDARTADGYISIAASSNTKALTAVAPRKFALLARTGKPVRDLIHRKNRWVLTLYPTAAYAQDAELGGDAFTEFVARALFLDRRDPVAAWRALRARQEKVLRQLRGAREIRIQAPGTDLRLRVDGRKFVNSCGYRNMPSGEVFTSPVEDSAEGRIAFSFPACHGGREVDGVRLEFRRGKVVKAGAAKNEAYLKAMLATDAGAKRLGEFAFGLNFGITRHIKNILFDEKIGGTIHLALGGGFAEAGGRNRSAMHWDMILDLRAGGRVLVDGRPFVPARQ